MNKLLIALALFAGIASRPGKETAFFRSELIFPPQALHNHGSCIVECPNGDLLTCWYRGHGERKADDVAIYGSRLRKGSHKWSAPFVMADTPGFPDTNPCLIIDHQKRLWLFWADILANRWETALMKYNISDDYMQREGPPKWKSESVMPLKPGPEFLKTVKKDMYIQCKPYLDALTGKDKTQLLADMADSLKRANNELDVRIGWMTRAHPFLFRDPHDPRMIVPLYSDGFNFSMMAITDDGGATWKCSEPIVGAGDVQPSIAERKDGVLVAFFRNNGPPPAKVFQSESKDRGMTWSLPHLIDLPDPGAGLEIIVLKSGRWLLVNNDTVNDRDSLAVTVSEDEGRTWLFKRHIEHDVNGPGEGSYAYPSIIQASDGTIHVTYSYTPNSENAKREGAGESIKHVQFNEAWLLEKRPR